MRHPVLAAVMLLLPGCAAQFGDVHHFATVNTTTHQVENIFRVTVSGHAEMTNARYIAGFYDERAVDLFFNEVKAGDLTPGRGADPIFKTVDCTGLDDAACKAKQDQVLRIVPVGSEAGNHGTFVLILSTNADAIAGTIGAFSESDLAVQSALYLATKGDHDHAAAITASSSTTNAGRRSTMTSIKSLLAITPTTAPAASQRNLAVLRAAAAGIAPDGPPPTFTTVEEARLWFASQPRGGGR